MSKQTPYEITRNHKDQSIPNIYERNVCDITTIKTLPPSRGKS